MTYPAAVLAGGLGTRMAESGFDLPKALLPVAGRPFIDFKLGSLAAQGVRQVVLLLGHAGEEIGEHVGDGKCYGLDVSTVFDGPKLLGTGGALRRARDRLGTVFWVTYGDSYLRAPMAPIAAEFERQNWDGLMVVLRNKDRWDRSNIRLLENGRVGEYQKGAPRGSFEFIDYGLSILKASSLDPFPPGETFDLAEVFQRLIRAGRLGSFVAGTRFHEIGTPAGYRATHDFLRRTHEWRRLTESCSSLTKL